MTKLEVVHAFKDGRVGKCHNARTWPGYLQLHQSVIAALSKHSGLEISTNGFSTRTTLSWLNLIIRKFGFQEKITSRQDQLFISELPWDGSTVHLESWLYHARRYRDITQTVAAGISR